MGRYAIQVWAPIATLSPWDRVFRQDIQRAEQHWQGETRIWLVPELNRAVRWTCDDGSTQCAVPARRPECVTIYTVDGARRVHPRLPIPGWQRELPGTLYRKWLNGNVKARGFPNEVCLDWPTFKAGRFAGYEGRTFTTQPPPHVPVKEFDKLKREMKFDWDWNDAPGPHPVSPESESKDVWGTPTRSSGLGNEGFATLDDPAGREKKLGMVSLRWEKPFDTLLPNAGLDTVRLRDIMLSCICTTRDGDPSLAIKKAQMVAAQFESKAEAPRHTVEILPKYSAAVSNRDRRAFLMNMKEDYSITAPTPEEVIARSERMLRRPAQVTRLTTWLGYFWWEFLHDITEHRFVGVCQKCGQVIAGGHIDRKFCSQSENEDCVRIRDAARKRKQRHAGA